MLPEGNRIRTLAAQLPFILNGLSYINFHTMQFGGGEIRGQILQSDSVSVPEPATLALLGIGVACFGLRRKSAALTQSMTGPTWLALSRLTILHDCTAATSRGPVHLPVHSHLIICSLLSNRRALQSVQP